MTVCVGDWIKLRCGDKVTEIDGRHVARVEAIHSGGSEVRVCWEDTGWISFFERRELVRL